MQQLTDRQIDFIINDIRARGVTMESLQADLVDHVCCILENMSGDGGDFEQRYKSVIVTFFRKELSEIEAETLTLLNNKNYYAMKKVMIVTGVISASLMAMGIALKFLHMPGAALGITAGTALFSFIFLPLMVALKMKDNNSSRNKALAITGTIAAVLMSVGILFKIMHWPMANMLGMISIGVLCLIYLPINLVTGLRHAETKVNSIVTSIVLVASCALFLSLVRSPHGTRINDIRETEAYLRTEQVLNNEKTFIKKSMDGRRSISASANDLITKAEAMKSFLLQRETGYVEIPSDFKIKNAFVTDTYLNVFIGEQGEGREIYSQLRESYNNYNAAFNNHPLPENLPLFDLKDGRVNQALHDLVMIEMLVLQKERL